MQAIETSDVSRFYDGPSQFAWENPHQHLHVGFFDQTTLDLAAAQDRLVHELVAPLGISKFSNVLDVGCGVGTGALLVRQLYGCQVMGITISQMQRAKAIQSITQAGLNASVGVFLMDAHSMDIPDATFDCVVAIESVGHMNKERAFVEMKRVLRTSGQLGICDWFLRQELTAAEAKLLHSTPLSVPESPDLVLGLLDQYAFDQCSFIDWTRAVEPTYHFWREGVTQLRERFPRCYVDRIIPEYEAVLSIAASKLGYGAFYGTRQCNST